MSIELNKGDQRTLEWVTVLALLTFVILGTMFCGSLTPPIVNGHTEQAEQYLESHTFQNISMREFYRLVFGDHSFYIDSKMKIGDFQLGLTKDYKVRVMLMDIIDTSIPSLKRYSIQYNRDSNYFKVLEFPQEKNERFDRPASSFLSQLD